MCPGVSLGVLGYPGVSWGNQTDAKLMVVILLGKLV